MEQQNNPQNAPVYRPYPCPPPAPMVTFPVGKGELGYGLWTLACALVLCNSLICGGLNLGFALGQLGLMGGTALYLSRRGHRFGWYGGTLLALCAVITAGFVRADDVMKLLMVLVLLVVPALSFAIAAGQNRWKPEGLLSLLDAPRATFGLGFGTMGAMGRGLRNAFRAAGTLGRKTGAVGLGLLIALPVVALMLPLLISADAAFAGLLDLLPDFEVEEAVTTAILGFCLTVVLYTRGLALHHNPRSEKARWDIKGVHPLTVNTILLAVAVVYLAYLVSQLAYFVGGFAGILPEDYTMAEYARRGFFEMSELCAINLGLMALAVGLVRKETGTPLMTRLLCLFVGLITMFLVTAASAKMLMYIGSYGLTRARVLTEVFMLWLAVTTVLVCVWLFREKLPYMKLSMVVALALCAGLCWADVDARIAQYNVRAYQTGKLETVDLNHLRQLSPGVLPYIRELTEDADPDVAEAAVEILEEYYLYPYEDIRGWNYAEARAMEILEEYQEPEDAVTDETYGDRD